MKDWDSGAFPDPEVGRKVRADIKSGLRYNYDPLFEWRPLPSQKRPTIEIDRHGLRTAGESRRGSFRIVLLGGSFAWGYGASCNAATPAGVIQELLRARGLDAELINLAEQNYNSTHELRSFVFTVSDLKPQAVIAITGLNDISTAFTGMVEYNNRTRGIMTFVNWGIRTGIITETSRLRMLLRVWQKFGERFDRDVDPQRKRFSDVSGPDAAVRLSRQKIDVIGQYCRSVGIKTVFVLQPSIYTRNKVSPSEDQHLREFVAHRREFFAQAYALLKQEIWENAAFKSSFGNAAKFVKASAYFDDLEGTYFFDAGHTSDRGYRVLSEKLVSEIAPYLTAN